MKGRTQSHRNTISLIICWFYITSSKLGTHLWKNKFLSGPREKCNSAIILYWIQYLDEGLKIYSQDQMRWKI